MPFKELIDWEGGSFISQKSKSTHVKSINGWIITVSEAYMSDTIGHESCGDTNEWLQTIFTCHQALFMYAWLKWLMMRKK